MRLPQVHDPVKQGFVSYLIAVAREKRVSAYVGEGRTRCAAGHRLDTAHLYRLALERGSAGVRYHAVGEEGVPMKEIAEAIGRGLKVPVVAVPAEEVMQHFGFLGNFAALDMPASSALTQERLGWRPSRPGLIFDLDEMNFEA
jgi:nucleoside-diphosphate-sugar epimerase